MAHARLNQRAGALVELGSIHPQIAMLPSQFEFQIVDFLRRKLCYQPAEYGLPVARAAQPAIGAALYPFGSRTSLAV
jgi:hypothetical protein